MSDSLNEVIQQELIKAAKVTMTEPEIGLLEKKFNAIRRLNNVGPGKSSG